jgi:hypothetical protein
MHWWGGVQLLIAPERNIGLSITIRDGCRVVEIQALPEYLPGLWPKSRYPPELILLSYSTQVLRYWYQ